MSFAPYAVLWVALLIAAGLLAAIRSRPRFTWALLLGTPAAAISLWFLGRPTSNAAAWNIAGRQWSIDDSVWQLTGVTLLLLVATVVHWGLNRPPGGDEHTPTWSFGLAAAALPVLWAADARTSVMSLTLFALVWVASALFPQGGATSTFQRQLIPALPLLPALFSLWLAGAMPAVAMPAYLLAAVCLLLTRFPGEQPASDRQLLALLGDGLPVVLGAAVLAAGLRAAPPAGAAVAVVTALGLLAMVIGLWQAWYHWPERLPQALRLALSGLVLTAAVWVGLPALLPAVRLAVFAPALLMVSGALRADGDVVSTGRWAAAPRTIAAIAVGLIVAGIPLTVGFSLLAPLYATWLASSGWVLLAVSAILLTLWLATLFLAARHPARGAPGERAGWLPGVALLPPLAGLIHSNVAALGAGPVVWAVIALPVVIGLLLARFVPAPKTLGGLLREAAMLPPPAAGLTQRIRQAGAVANDSLSDALAILEGENNLLWLLGLLLLLAWLA